MDDKAIIDLFFERSEQAIRELDTKYGQKTKQRIRHRFGGAGKLPVLRHHRGGRGGGKAVSPNHRGLSRHSVPGQPGDLYAALLVFRQLRRNCPAGGDRRKGRVRPAYPHSEPTEGTPYKKGVLA